MGNIVMRPVIDYFRYLSSLPEFTFVLSEVEKVRKEITGSKKCDHIFSVKKYILVFVYDDKVQVYCDPRSYMVTAWKSFLFSNAYNLVRNRLGVKPVLTGWEISGVDGEYALETMDMWLTEMLSPNRETSQYKMFDQLRSVLIGDGHPGIYAYSPVIMAPYKNDPNAVSLITHVGDVYVYGRNPVPPRYLREYNKDTTILFPDAAHYIPKKRLSRLINHKSGNFWITDDGFVKAYVCQGNDTPTAIKRVAGATFILESGRPPWKVVEPGRRKEISGEVEKDFTIPPIHDKDYDEYIRFKNGSRRSLSLKKIIR